MTAMVALLRGVNVGGRGLVSMTDIRAAATGCGYTGVSTYVQSGNLVFAAEGESTAEVAEALRSAIAETTAVRPDVMVRTRAELHGIIAASPFLDRSTDPLQPHVLFLPDHVPSALDGINMAQFAPAEAAGIGREVFLYLPGGTGRSKLAAAVQKHTAGAGTQRNWRTVTKLAELADNLADPE